MSFSSPPLPNRKSLFCSGKSSASLSRHVMLSRLQDDDVRTASSSTADSPSPTRPPVVITHSLIICVGPLLCLVFFVDDVEMSQWRIFVVAVHFLRAVSFRLLRGSSNRFSISVIINHVNVVERKCESSTARILSRNFRTESFAVIFENTLENVVIRHEIGFWSKKYWVFKMRFFSNVKLEFSDNVEKIVHKLYLYYK